MKKIKWILLFWILTLLWIGSSFWWYIWSVIYELAWYNRNYQFYVWNSSSQYWVYYISWLNNNIPVFSTLNSFYYSLYSWNLLFNELWIWTWRWSSITYSPASNLYYWIDFVSLFWKYNSNSGSIWNFNNSSNRSIWNYINTFNSLRLFLSTESNSMLCLFPETSNSELTWFYWWCNIDNYQIFPYNLWYSINSKSNSVYDSTYNSWTSILNSRKTAVFPWLWQWYSFIFEGINIGWWFRSIFSWTLVSEDFSTFNNRWYVQNKYIDWQLIFNVNNTSNWWNNWETIIIAIDALRTWYYMYSLYSCSDTIISNCSFIEGWKLYSGSDLIVPSFDWNVDSFYNWFNYISSWQYYYLPIVYTSFDDSLNLLTFTRYWIRTQSSTNAPRINFSKSINLVPWEWWDNFNLLKYLGIQWWDVSWDWSQSTWSIAINTWFLDLCLNNLEFWELNSYLCNSLLNWSDLVMIPNHTWYYLSYWYDENWNLRFWLTYQEDLEQQMSWFVWVQDEAWNRYTTCPSWTCWWNLLAKPIIHVDSWEVFELTTWDVLDMMSNLTGWVGRCPFPYSDFRLWNNLKLLQLLQDYWFNYDPFIIINCSVAWFQYWRHTIDTILFWDTFEHPLLYWDTSKHRTLFTFLDFVVILWLFWLFTFFKKIF